MNKTDLIKKIAANTGTSQADAKRHLDATLEEISAALCAGEKIPFMGFGTFSVSDRAARTGRNPQTGKSMEIPARKVAKFKAGKTLVDSLNK